MQPSNAVVLRRQWTKNSAGYGERYPLDEDFLAAVASMPQASGVALGFDRLVMLASGRSVDRSGGMEPPP